MQPWFYYGFNSWPLLTMPFFTISTQDLASLVIRGRCMNTGFVEKKDVAEAPFVRLPAHRRWILHPPMGQTLWKGLRRIRPYGKAIVGRAMSLLLSPRPDQKGAAVSGLRYVKQEPFTDWNLESSIKFGRWKDIWDMRRDMTGKVGCCIDFCVLNDLSDRVLSIYMTMSLS